MALVGDTSELKEFRYGGEPILPEQSSYQVQIPNGVVTSSLEGGLSKQQIQFYNSPYLVSVEYVGLDGFKTEFIENFLERHRGQTFIAYLMISSGKIEPFVVQYVGSPKVSKTGFNGSVSLTLEIEPAIDRCYQQFMQDWGTCLSGKEICQIEQNLREAVELWP